MERKLKYYLNKILKIFNLKLLKYSTFLELTEFRKKLFDIATIAFMKINEKTLKFNWYLR